MFDVINCSFIYLVSFGVVWDRRINASFTPLCWLKWRSPCNQNSLNSLWMLGTDFCTWVQTWLRICVGALGRPSLAGETRQLQIAFAMGYVQSSSVAQSCLTLCNPMDCSTSGLLSFTNIWTCSNSCASNWWCYPTISSSVVLFSPCPQSFPVIGSFTVSKFFTSVGQNIGPSTSASVLPINIHDWFPLALAVWISL